MKDEYFAELNATKAADVAKPAVERAAPGSKSGMSAAKTKPKLKKKAANDDPFVSEDEDGKPPEPGKPSAGAGVKKAPLRKKAKAEPEFDDGDEERPADANQKRDSPSQEGSKQNAAKRSKDPHSESEEERPKKTVRRTGAK